MMGHVGGSFQNFTPSRVVRMAEKSQSKFQYDVIVIGTGPGGEGAAMQAVKGGRKVAVVERYNPSAAAVPTGARSPARRYGSPSFGWSRRTTTRSSARRASTSNSLTPNSAKGLNRSSTSR